MILLDMDGVLVDFVGAVRRLLPSVPPDERWPPGSHDLAGLGGVSEAEMWRRVDAEGPGWWADLEPYPWAADLLDLAGPAAVVVTSPHRHPACHAGKAEALRRLLPGARARRYAMVPRHLKRLLAAPGRVLVDDHDVTVAEFRAAGGEAVLFPRPWNARHAEAADPLPVALAAVRAARGGRS